MPQDTKFCRGCSRTLPLDDFPTDNGNPDGKHSRCKECHGIACAKWARSHRANKRANWQRWITKKKNKEA